MISHAKTGTFKQIIERPQAIRDGLGTWEVGADGKIALFYGPGGSDVGKGMGELRGKAFRFYDIAVVDQKSSVTAAALHRSSRSACSKDERDSRLDSVLLTSQSRHLVAADPIRQIG
jgi:hypothetical protein